MLIPRSMRWSGAIWTALVAWAAGTLDAQVTELRGEACPSCEIALTPVVDLGDADGAGMLERDFNNVHIDRRGRYYVFSALPYFWVFEADGELVDRIGTEGQGPGEFEWVTGVVPDPHDSLFVFDLPQGRATVLSPDLTFERNVLLPTRVLGQGRFAGSAILLNEGLRTDGMLGQPLHLLDRQGQIKSSFGAPDGQVYRPEQREIIEMRQVTPAEDGTFWVARINEYLIERWDTTGRLVETLRRRPEWFPKWDRPEGDAQTQPVPIFAGITTIGDTLYVLVQVPGPDWRSAVKPSGRLYEVTDPDVYRNTLIEAIDLTSHEVIASSRFPEVLNGFVGPGLVSGSATDERGNPIVRILRVGVRR